ncbi:MAG: flagellin, partial [Chitinivibrionia bacterium]|nr:flagellin [Chitinivibrionia bacterium]
MRINNNISSMHTQGALFQNNRAVGKDLEKLSTGFRINRASDDAAGLAVSEGLRTQVRGQTMAKRNALDGISALNIAEGAMNEIHAIMQRQRELAVQSSNATYTSTERAYMDAEFQALTSEITRIVNVTNFNGIKLLTDDSAFIEDHLQVDANNEDDDRIQITYESVEDVTGNVTDQTSARAAIDELDGLIEDLSESRSSIGALVNRLESTINNLTVSITNQQAAESQIRDVDFA